MLLDRKDAVGHVSAEEPCRHGGNQFLWVTALVIRGKLMVLEMGAISFSVHVRSHLKEVQPQENPWRVPPMSFLSLVVACGLWLKVELHMPFGQERAL